MSNARAERAVRQQGYCLRQTPQGTVPLETLGARNCPHAVPVRPVESSQPRGARGKQALTGEQFMHSELAKACSPSPGLEPHCKLRAGGLLQFQWGPVQNPEGCDTQLPSPGLPSLRRTPLPCTSQTSPSPDLPPDLAVCRMSLNADP